MLKLDFNAEADLHKISPMQTEARLSPKYQYAGKLRALVRHVMENVRCAERQLYSIMVGERIIYAVEIENLYVSASRKHPA